MIIPYGLYYVDIDKKTNKKNYIFKAKYIQIMHPSLLSQTSISHPFLYHSHLTLSHPLATEPHQNY